MGGGLYLNGFYNLKNWLGFKFTNNTANVGGGLYVNNFPNYIASDALSSYDFLTGMVFKENKAQARGGGLYLQCDPIYLKTHSPIKFQLTKLEFYGNVAYEDGGGLAMENELCLVQINAIILDSIFQNNTAVLQKKIKGINAAGGALAIISF